MNTTQHHPSPKLLANAIRILSMDAVQHANSGHPGAPMGMADIAEVLWNNHLKHNPGNPNWINRDRFVLSNGHASMLLYSLLHLSGYDLDLEELKNFRQLGSATPGHPELHDTPGVETTTGPLGQGIANAVGMAIAERTLAAKFNKNNHCIIDHHTYVFMGDGCLMEGISHESCSLAGTLKLGKLIAIYDDNGISIDGEVDGWFTDDTQKRFEAYGWHVVANVDGHNSLDINKAIESAKLETNKPSLIIAKTTIGKGSPNKQGSESCHGSPLGNEESDLVRQALGWNEAPFVIPPQVSDAWDHRQIGADEESEWNALLAAYSAQHPDLSQELIRRTTQTLPTKFTEEADAYISQLQANGESIASRQASQNALNAYGPLLPELLGGSADLAASNLTLWKDCKVINGDSHNGNYINYGVREFGMSAIMNGIGVHGGFITYGATFLVFMEYARNAVRLAALMKQQSIFVYTHDSIGLGEDGPTHQPIEQLTNLYTTPNLITWRPCDTVETAVAWKCSIVTNDQPSCIVLSRQKLDHQLRNEAQLSNIQRGGYTLYESQDRAIDCIIIATGSEVGLAIKSAKQLEMNGLSIRVVSMPSPSLFDTQDDDYKNTVLPESMRARVAIEAGHKDYWMKYVGLDGDVIGISTFGKSAPANQLYNYFGFTVDDVVTKVNHVIKKNTHQ
jgi:transketolase